MPLDFGVVVDVGTDPFPVRKNVRIGTQRIECRPVQLLEQAEPARIRTFAKRTGVQAFEQFRDCFIQRSQVEEPSVPEGRDDPALSDLYSGLDFRLVEKRALQTVVMVAYRFSPSHTLSIR
jgi:hypothetical protein